MWEGLKDRRLMGLVPRHARANRLANLSERDPSPKSITLTEIRLNADFAELGPSSSLPCGPQTAMALIPAINHHGLLSPSVGYPPPLPTNQTPQTSLDLPSTCHIKTGNHHHMQLR